jgi:hypothetical protein
MTAFTPLRFVMSPLPRSFRDRLSAVAATLLLAAIWLPPAFGANLDYTDNWYVPAESGWGVNLTQTDNFIFATFFIYDANKKPTWYTGHLTWDGQSQFAGPLKLTSGTKFSDPWVPGELTEAQVGTASFTPSTANNYEGTLTYTVTGVGKVTKSGPAADADVDPAGGKLRRRPAGSYSGCATASSNRLYQDFFNLRSLRQARA